MIIFCPIYCSKKIVSNCKKEKEFFLKNWGGGKGVEANMLVEN
jgi:hypothetical protein